MLRPQSTLILEFFMPISANYLKYNLERQHRPSLPLENLVISYFYRLLTVTKTTKTIVKPTQNSISGEKGLLILMSFSI